MWVWHCSVKLKNLCVALLSQVSYVLTILRELASMLQKVRELSKISLKHPSQKVSVHSQKVSTDKPQKGGLFRGTASLHIGLPVRSPACLPACLFQLASGEVSLTILTSNIVGEYRRVFYNYPGPKNEQCHTQTVKLAEQCHTQNFYLRCFKSDFDAIKNKFGLLIE